jgi:hypothetical protein
MKLICFLGLLAGIAANAAAGENKLVANQPTQTQK